MAQVLAIDLGGSGMKLGLFADSGAVLAQARVSLAFDEGFAGHSEADPESWSQALLQGVTQMGVSLGNVGMVAICGFTRTQVFLDAENKVLRPAFGFRDTRAMLEASALQQHLGEDAGLNGFHPLARLAWLKKHEPDHWAQLAYVIEPKDYLILRLTGRVASDAISLKLLKESYAGAGRSLAARVGLDKDLLPPIGAPLDSVAQVQSGLPAPLADLRGADVMLGTNDTWMAVAGMGAMAAGRAYCVSGSSEVLGLLSEAPASAKGLVQVQWGDRLWHLGGPGQNGSNVQDWAEAAFATTTADDQNTARDLRKGLLFLPFLQGERVPYWDGDLRGAMLGLDDKATPADLRIAALAGVAHMNRLVLERAEAGALIRADALRIGGGGSRNRLWNQIRADVTGRDILVSPAQEMGLAGLHAAARVALGEARDLSQAATQTLPPFDIYHPDPAMRDYHDQMHAIFSQAHEALAPISHLLVKAASDGR